MTEKPPPAFSIGERVRVILGERNQTSRTGTIREIVWHYKDQRYIYFIEENGKKVAKRYFQDDFERLPPND